MIIVGYTDRTKSVIMKRFSLILLTLTLAGCSNMNIPDQIEQVCGITGGVVAKFPVQEYWISYTQCKEDYIITLEGEL